MINKIDKLHKAGFITISIIFLLLNTLFVNIFTYEIQIYALFFLVSIIGLPHGFFDFTVGKNIFKKYNENWFLYFSFSYLSIAILYFLLWNNIPTYSLLFFLIISALHFGYEDYNYLSNTKKRVSFNINILIKGLMIVFTPILFHYDEICNLFFILTDYEFQYYEINFFYKIVYLVFFIFYIILEKNRSILFKLEGFVYLMNFILLPPLLSFTLYFCFVHSIRHFIESSIIYSYIPDNFSPKSFFVSIILFSLIFSVIAIFLIGNFFNIDTNDVIVKYIFILLACLTLPHMIFNISSNSN